MLLDMLDEVDEEVGDEDGLELTVVHTERRTSFLKS
jgi:hypothetical protein